MHGRFQQCAMPLLDTISRLCLDPHYTFSADKFGEEARLRFHPCCQCNACVLDRAHLWRMALMRNTPQPHCAEHQHGALQATGPCNDMRQVLSLLIAALGARLGMRKEKGRWVGGGFGGEGGRGRIHVEEVMILICARGSRPRSVNRALCGVSPVLFNSISRSNKSRDWILQGLDLVCQRQANPVYPLRRV